MVFWNILSDNVEKISKDNEKRRQAREYIKRAKEIVKDYDERYNNTYANTISYAYKTQRKLEEHCDFKKRLIRELDLDFKPVLDKFDRFDIDRKTFNVELIDMNNREINFNNSAAGSLFNGLESRMSLSTVIGSRFSIFDLFDNGEEEYWEAKRQLDEAKRYKQEIQYQREKLKSMKSNLSDVQSYIYDEKQMLESLKEKIKKITSTLEKEMKRTSFTKEESDKLKSMHKIAKGISKLMSMKFLNDDFSITNEYKKTYENITNVNNMLPNTPNINDNTWREIARMLDSIVVY